MHIFKTSVISLLTVFILASPVSSNAALAPNDQTPLLNLDLPLPHPQSSLDRRFVSVDGQFITRLPLYSTPMQQSLLVEAVLMVRAGKLGPVKIYARFGDDWVWVNTTSAEREAIFRSFLQALFVARPQVSVTRAQILDENFKWLFFRFPAQEALAEFDNFDLRALIPQLSLIEESNLVWNQKSLRRAVIGVIRILRVREALDLRISPNLRRHMDGLLETALENVLLDCDCRHQIFLNRRTTEEALEVERPLLQSIARGFAEALRSEPLRELEAALVSLQARAPVNRRKSARPDLIEWLKTKLEEPALRCGPALVEPVALLAPASETPFKD